MTNPDLCIAALLRARAESGTWTPGLVLDYARSLHAVIEPQRRSWRRRLQAAVRRWRRRRGGMAKRAAWRSARHDPARGGAGRPR